MKYVFFALSGISIAGALLPLVPSRHYLFQGWEFPVVQLFVLGLTGFLGSLWFADYSSIRWWTYLGITALILFYFAWIIFPYTFLAPVRVKQVDQPQPERSIKVLSCNTLIDNRETAPLKAQIEQYQPDIIALLEPDAYWAGEMAYLKETYPYFVEEPLDNAYGLLFYSKLKTEGTELRYMVEEGVPSVVTTVFLPDGTPVRVYVVHPKPPSPTENETSTERDAELLLYAQEIADEKLPVIIFGDLNDVAWSNTTRMFQRMSNLLDPRLGRRPFHTFHTEYPLLRWPLDHIFHSDDFMFVRMERLPNIQSDHFPIFIELEYHPNAEQRQQVPTTNLGDEEIAEEVIEDAREKD